MWFLCAIAIVGSFYGHNLSQTIQPTSALVIYWEKRVITNLVASLRQHPELAVFLTLALGFILGRVRIGTWVFDTVGLAVFIGVVGLNAGPSFVTGLRVTRPSLLLVGFIAVIPHVVALLSGRYVLNMNPVILFGACAGAGTVTAALRAIQNEAGSKLPVLGYTVPYAVGNILLTAWCPVIVMLTR